MQKTNVSKESLDVREVLDFFMRTPHKHSFWLWVSRTTVSPLHCPVFSVGSPAWNWSCRVEFFVFRCCWWDQRYDLDRLLSRKQIYFVETIEQFARTVVWIDFSFCVSSSNSCWAEKPWILSLLKYLCTWCNVPFFLLLGVSISPYCCCIFRVITDTGRCFLHPKPCDKSSSALSKCALLLCWVHLK